MAYGYGLYHNKVPLIYFGSSTGTRQKCVVQRRVKKSHELARVPIDAMHRSQRGRVIFVFVPPPLGWFGQATLPPHPQEICLFLILEEGGKPKRKGKEKGE